MKKTTSLILFLVSNFLFSQITNTSCVYKISYNENKTETKSTNSIYQKQADELIKEVIKIAEKFNYILVYNKKESFFKLEEFVEDTYKTKIAKVLIETNFYQNKKENLILHQFEVFGDEFLVHQPLKDSNWEITSIKKKIGKYTCYKAINTCKSCNKKNIIEVWFTPDIPVPFGPIGYGGLPGLVVEVKMKSLTLRLASISKDTKYKIKRPSKGKYVTLQEYKKIAIDIRSRY